MKIKTLSINPMYAIFSDGRLFNNYRKRFVKASPHSRLKPKFLVYDIYNCETNRREKIGKHRLKHHQFETDRKGHHSELNIIRNE